MENTAEQLALWVLKKYPYRGSAPALTHLKLQKLCFYAAACAWAHDAGEELSSLSFEAWKHGPVLRDVFTRFRETGAQEIAASPEAPTFSEETERRLGEALNVYGSLSAWSLVEQSHTEAPWAEARANETPGGKPQPISRESVERHFKQLWTTGKVQVPTYLVDPGIFKLDGTPFDLSFKSFSDLSSFVSSQLSNA